MKTWFGAYASAASQSRRCGRRYSIGCSSSRSTRRGFEPRRTKLGTWAITSETARRTGIPCAVMGSATFEGGAPSSSSRLGSAKRALARHGAGVVHGQRNHAAWLTGDDPVDQEVVALRRHRAHERHLLVEDHRRQSRDAKPRRALGTVAQDGLVRVTRVVGLEPLDVQSDFLAKAAQHGRAADVQMLPEQRSEEPVVKSRERASALALSAL